MRDLSGRVLIVLGLLIFNNLNKAYPNDAPAHQGIPPAYGPQQWFF